jgi:large exoprotein involved in heme utilization and adhesion
LTAGNGGVLDIQATDSLILTDGGSINVTAAAGSAGNAGSATIKTASLTMDGGFISGAARSSGKGGILDIYASDSIKLSNWSFVYVDTSESGDAGTLTINTPRLNVDGRSSISSETLSSGRGGDLFIKATDSIDLNNSGYISVSTFGTGDAGTADIKTGKLNIDGGFIAGSTYAASGRGGDIIINAADSINLTNAGSISVDTSNAGDSGIVSINTGALSIDNYSYISGTTWSSGKGGKLNISASDSITIANFGEISVKTGSTGAAGTAVIDTAKLNIDNGGISGATVSFGKGGGVEINASDSIKVTNQGYISVSALAGSGDAGDISINTNRLSVDELGYITGSTATSGKGGNLVINATDSISLTNSGSIFVDTHAAGDSGAVAIQTGRLHINGFLSYISGTTWSSGKGGKVNISANTIELSDLAVITSGSNGTGAAGDLIITAAGLVKLNNGSITTATADADGGNIAIHPGAIDLYNGRISTSVAGGTGNGGNIDLAAKALVLDNSSIIANAEGGNGGNINLSTGALIKSRSGGVISASSRLGLEGTIFISAPLIDLGGALADMPDTILDLDALLPKRCASGDEGISSFTILEQAAVPANPDRPLATP